MPAKTGRGHVCTLKVLKCYLWHCLCDGVALLLATRALVFDKLFASIVMLLSAHRCIHCLGTVKREREKRERRHVHTHAAHLAVHLAMARLAKTAHHSCAGMRRDEQLARMLAFPMACVC